MFSECYSFSLKLSLSVISFSLSIFLSLLLCDSPPVILSLYNYISLTYFLPIIISQSLPSLCFFPPFHLSLSLFLSLLPSSSLSIIHPPIFDSVPFFPLLLSLSAFIPLPFQLSQNIFYQLHPIKVFIHPLLCSNGTISNLF
jgi:hypothetical protein